MSEIVLHGRSLESIFELLGSQENDITYSVGWVLAQCPQFQRAFLKKLFPKLGILQDCQVRLQHFTRNQGVTDIEVLNPDVHVIVEAKRGWNLPNYSQLRRYASILRRSEKPRSVLAVIAECSRDYADRKILQDVDGVKIQYMSWEDVYKLAECRTRRHAERGLLEELRTYLRRMVKMQEQESNMVFLVALSHQSLRWSQISYVDIVNQKRRYFHPFGRNGWPSSPPNYIGFRYDGELQTIHHVESSRVVNEMHSHIPEIDRGDWGDYMLYDLGPPIRPAKVVLTGKRVWPNVRLWAALDLLLTSGTIKQACRKTKKRLAQIG